MHIEMSTGHADASLVQDVNASSSICIQMGSNSTAATAARAAPATRSLVSNGKRDTMTRPDYEAAPAYEPPDYVQSEYAVVDYTGVAEPLGDAVYETYEDITDQDGSALPELTGRPDPDHIDPNAARSAMHAGEDHPYEYQDIGSSKLPGDDNYGELYGFVLYGTITEPRETTGGSPSGTEVFTRAADGSVYLRPAQGRKSTRPVGLRQSSDL